VGGGALLLVVLLGLEVALGVSWFALIERRPHLARFPAAVLLPVTVGIFVMASVPAAVSTPLVRAASAASVRSLVAVSTTIQSLPSNLDVPVGDESITNIGFPPASTGCVTPYGQSTVPACVFGDRTATRTVVLYGDSHAGMWFQALDDIATRDHWKLVILFKPACLANPMPTHPPKGTGSTAGEWTACDQWHRFARARIHALDPDVLVVAQSITQTPEGVDYTPAQWRRGIVELLNRTRAARKLILGDIPTSPGPTCLGVHRDSVQTCAGVPQVQIDRAERRAALSTGAQYVNTTPWFCAQRRCSPVIGHFDVYFDPVHVAIGYSRFLEGVLGKALGV